MANSLADTLFKTQPPASAMTSLGLGGSLTPQEIEERRKRLMAAAGGAGNDGVTRYAGLASNLFSFKPPVGY